MTTTTQRPPGRKLQARIFRIVNVPMRALLSLPVPTPLSRRLMLLHHTGRVDGQALPAADQLRPRRRHPAHPGRRSLDPQPERR